MADRRVWKYPLSLRPGPQRVTLPALSEIVHVHAQNDTPTLWAQVDGAVREQTRTFYVVATGEPIPEHAEHYVGTVHIGWTVWHIFEKP